MHCHPIKTTCLIVLDGEAKLSFLADSKNVKALEKATLRRGLFHSTEALSKEGAMLFEMEYPPGKNDLIRHNDRYGRSGEPYESATVSLDAVFHIDEPSHGGRFDYRFAGCDITVETTSSTRTINDKQDSDILLFLRGGIIRKVGGFTKLACIPGDVEFAGIVKQMASQLDGLLPHTVLMTIHK